MKQRINRGASAPLNPKKGFRIHLLVFILTLPVLWTVWYLTDRSYPWPVFSTVGWSIGIFFHYMKVFVFNKSSNS